MPVRKSALFAAFILLQLSYYVTVSSQVIESGIQSVAQAVVDLVTTQCENIENLLNYESLIEENLIDGSDLALVLRTREGNFAFNLSEAATLLMESPSFNMSNKIVVYMHGWNGSPFNDVYYAISDSFLQLGGYHTFALDSTSLVKSLYVRAMTYAQWVSMKFARILANLYESGLPRENIFVFGYSMGAHMAGFTGKWFYNYTGVKLPRITGLEPAGPCFLDVTDELRLHKSDADFVDIIHTNQGVTGFNKSIGDVDFYVNGGSLQPGCLHFGCNHGRSVRLFTESITSQAAFPAKKCADWASFEANLCDDADIAFMGFPVSSCATGDYYLRTAGESPFGLGQDGLLPN